MNEICYSASAAALCAADRVGLGMCRKSAQTIAATRHSKARPNRPPAKLPVASFMTPTYQAPKKPPRLPIELIQAMPPASAVPLRNIGGIAQNGPLEP